MWTPEDADLAMALIHIEDDTCAGCGQPLSVSLSRDSDPDGGTHKYEAPPPARCHACTAIAATSETYSTDKTPHQHALKYSARRVPRT